MGTARLFSTTLILLLISALFLASGSAQDYTRWHLPEGAIVRFEKGGVRDFAYLPDGNRRWIRAMAFSPDGKTLASGNNGTVILWDMNRIPVPDQ